MCVGRLVGLSFCHNLLKGREVPLPCSYRSTCLTSSNDQSGEAGLGVFVCCGTQEDSASDNNNEAGNSTSNPDNSTDDGTKKDSDNDSAMKTSSQEYFYEYYCSKISINKCSDRSREGKLLALEGNYDRQTDTDRPTNRQTGHEGS